jgi:hypothetical protein
LKELNIERLGTERLGIEELNIERLGTEELKEGITGKFSCRSIGIREESINFE